MKNYWMRIALGALAIFAVGMVGVMLARRGIGGVRGVVEGTGPITLPVAFIPFKLNGEKLGTVSKVVLHRDAPKRIASVELMVKLSDSVLARGLEGCRLAANFDDKHGPRGVEIGAGPLSTGVFSCLHSGDSTPQFQQFGHAIFQPGNVSVPLLLPNDMVDDLKQGDFNSRDEDSLGVAADERADSIAEAMETRADSIATAAESRADSIVARSERLIDSLRREGKRRADSTRLAFRQAADSVRTR